jgi:hypothetical protein
MTTPTTANPAAPLTNQHPCAYAWCDDTNHITPGHMGTRYTPATGRNDEPVPLSIGVAIIWDGPDEEPCPRMLVHTIDEIGDTDVDACLTLDEAIELRDILDTAISHVAGFHTEVVAK